MNLIILCLKQKKINCLYKLQDNSSISGQILQNVKIISGDALKDLQKENIIIVADENNREIGKIINNAGFFMLENERGKENVRILPKPDKSVSTEIKVEVKEETMDNGSNAPDYDEIERKMKEICDENEISSSNNNKSSKKIDCQSTETETILNLDDFNTEDSTENSCEEIEVDIEPENSRLKLKRKICESLNQDSTKSHEISNKLQKSKSIEDITDIIHDLENESSEENKFKKSKMVSSASNQSNKPIIKNDIQFKLKNRIINRPIQNTKIEVDKVNNLKCFDKSIIEKLTEKINTQGEVIELLTHQVISYKDISRKMQGLVQELNNRKKKINYLTQKLNEKDSQAEAKTSKCENNDHLKDANQAELISKINFLEGTNKKHMKTITVETQNRRKLELQLKNRDNQIKELNWKLEKASKFLDRAEKNANNYKKKMLATQALIRRKKLSNEKSSIPFDEFLIGQMDKNFSEDIMKKALEIQKTCGVEGYQVLLKYDFPLPPLNELSKKYPTEINYLEPEEEVTILSAEEAEIPVPVSNIKMENIEFLDQSNYQHRLEQGGEFLVAEFLNDSNETVTGTVQDIFNESDDEDQLNLLNDLRKHNILIELDDSD